MTSQNPDGKELKKVQRRISDIMRDFADEQERRQNLLSIIAHVSSANIQLMSRTASSVRENRHLENPEDMQATIKKLEREINEKEAVIGSLWRKLAELQEKERELEKQVRDK